MASLPARKSQRLSGAGTGTARIKPVPGTGMPSSRLDELLHHRIRLGIVSALAGADGLSFTELRTLLNTTDGNLSVHARKLEDAQYVQCTKTFEDRRPHTQYRLAAEGRRALQRYLDHMEAVIRATRTTLEG